MNKKIIILIGVIPIAIALFGYQKVSNTLGIQLIDLLTNKGLMILILVLSGISTFILKVKKKLNLFKCFIISFAIFFCVSGILGLGIDLYISIIGFYQKLGLEKWLLGK